LFSHLPLSAWVYESGLANFYQGFSPFSHNLFANRPAGGKFLRKIMFIRAGSWFKYAPQYMSKIVGIDLGTTNSLVATVDSGIPFVIADAQGRRLTPSVVHWASADAEATVGHEANRVRLVKPAETVYSVKRFMGRRGAEISDEEKSVTYPLNYSSVGRASSRAEDGSSAVSPHQASVTIPIHGRNYSPEEISAEVLKKLKRDAENYFGEPVTRAVITVPAYFNDAQRNATKRAGELAGFNVERIVNEPTAAALAYGLDKLKEKSKIAVYDLGGGTFDLSILELNEGVFQVLATNGNTRLGGDDLDKKLVDFLVEKITGSAGVPPASVSVSLTESAARDAQHGDRDGRATILSRIREAAEMAKIKLSAETEVEIALPFLTPDFSFSYKLTRAELENLTRDIIAHTRPNCLRALADAKLEAKDLDHIILVGGQTRMPLVRKFVGELFGCAEFEETRGSLRIGSDFHKASGPQLNTSQNPDEAVALGAAIQAEILSGGFKNVLLLDVTPLSLGIETFGGLMNVLIPRNSTIPLKAGELFTTAMDFQRNMLIHVLQGERERAKDNWSLGKFTIDFEAAPRGVPRVGVQFEIDANGILHVLARDTKTGKEKIVEMKSAVDVDDSAVQKMVEQSVEHAFDDLAARRWIEAKLKANETMTATRKALADFGGEIETDYREKIEIAAREVEVALATENAGGSGELKKLQTSIAGLDEATKPLADFLMDKAMEAMLRKRGLIQ
jgi:molecular chaperone DnaK